MGVSELPSFSKVLSPSSSKNLSSSHDTSTIAENSRPLSSTESSPAGNCQGGGSSLPQQRPSQSGEELDDHRQSVAVSATSDVLQEYSPGRLDIWMLGLTIVIGGQYFSWNAGLQAGLYSYLIAYFLTSIGYIILCCCTAEITGHLPFAGGAYGLSRCTLGFLPAFLVGACEALEYVAYVASSVVSLARMIVEAAPGLRGYEPLLWLAFYATALPVHIRGGRPFWYFIWFLGVPSTLILLLFCFGSLPYVNLEKSIPQHKLGNFVGGIEGFLRSLPLAPWFYVGVEALPLACDQVLQPKRVVPMAQAACALTLLFTGTMVYFITVSLPPSRSSGEEEQEENLSTVLLPFNNGFSQIFGLEDRMATIFSLPATYATAFGFMWCYGKLIAALASSRLLPAVLGQSSMYDTPAYALVAGTSLSYVLCLMVVFINGVEAYLYNLCIMSAFVAYAGQMVGYIAMKRHYFKSSKGTFTSPFGVPGAVVGLCIWLAHSLA